jgi:hypothetical protein
MVCEHTLPILSEAQEAQKAQEAQEVQALQIPDELKSPRPSLFVYYDSESQLIFQDKNMLPVEMRNYISPQNEAANFLEYSPPTLSKFIPHRDRDKLIIKFELDSIKSMPYGLAFWGDHTQLKLVSSNASDVVWVGEYLLFVKLHLTSGANQFEVVLSI